MDNNLDGIIWLVVYGTNIISFSIEITFGSFWYVLHVDYLIIKSEYGKIFVGCSMNLTSLMDKQSNLKNEKSAKKVQNKAASSFKNSMGFEP